jgi:threonine aldolase
MVKAIDLRSDTVTRPTPAMKQAMMEAPLGDDVFGDDPTVAALEARTAVVLGKEAALFVPSGTMGNQIALRVHTRAGDEAIAHAASHIYNWEAGAPAALWGVTIRAIASDDGTLPLDALQAAIRLTDDVHVANTRLVCLENTHNACGGVLLPPDHVARVAALARSRGLALHLDGARLFNASVASALAPTDLAREFDTVSVCLSKGLGAPVGSVLAGPARLIAAARRVRKMLGGGMRQAGIIAAAGLYALEHHVTRLADDHRRACLLAKELAALGPLRVDPGRVHTNIVYFGIDPAHPLGSAVAHGTPPLVDALAERGVLVTGHGTTLRAVTHLDVDDDAIASALDSFRAVLG